MYKPPITIYQALRDSLNIQLENNVCKAVASYGINVDKDELIKALKYDREQYEKGYEDGKAEIQWIPCSERLPECEWGAETEALMYQVGDTIYTGYFGRGGLWRDEYFRRYADIKEGVDASNVIAWMPLPEPYKEEE